MATESASFEEMGYLGQTQLPPDVRRAASPRGMTGPPLSAVRRGQSYPVARALGFFSLGLGVTSLLAPSSVARLIGIRGDVRSRQILRVVGARELVSGLGILVRRRPAGWLWARVAGDVVDLSLLGLALGNRRNDRERLLGATAAVAGIALIDLLTSRAVSGSPEPRPGDDTPEVAKYVTVWRPVEEVYAFWRDFRNFPRFMQNLDSVQADGSGRSHWVARAPFGRTVAWDAQIISDVPNKLIAWRSLPGSQIENWGEVRFDTVPGKNGTAVRVDIRYNLPGGKVAANLARLFAENPDREVYDDVRAFKQVMETGEVVMSDAVLGGRRFLQRPGQPAADPAHA